MKCNASLSNVGAAISVCGRVVDIRFNAYLLSIYAVKEMAHWSAE
jgi:hypothetical protein